MARLPISNAARRRLQRARVARLATVDAAGWPHVVPVCFAFDGRAFYTAIDLKPKQREAGELRRVLNLKTNPNVALLVDEYRKEWRRLWYVLIRGRAQLLRSGREWRAAHRLLRRKYPPYRKGLLPMDAPVIRILPERVVAWGRL